MDAKVKDKVRPREILKGTGIEIVDHWSTESSLRAYVDFVYRRMIELLEKLKISYSPPDILILAKRDEKRVQVRRNSKSLNIDLSSHKGAAAERFTSIVDGEEISTIVIWPPIDGDLKEITLQRKGRSFKIPLSYLDLVDWNLTEELFHHFQDGEEKDNPGFLRKIIMQMQVGGIYNNLRHEQEAKEYFINHMFEKYPNNFPPDFNLKDFDEVAITNIQIKNFGAFGISFGSDTKWRL